jgi:hypothetical protein
VLSGKPGDVQETLHSERGSLRNAATLEKTTKGYFSLFGVQTAASTEKF